MQGMTSRHAAKPGVALGWEATALSYGIPRDLGDGRVLGASTFIPIRTHATLKKTGVSSRKCLNLEAKRVTHAHAHAD